MTRTEKRLGREEEGRRNRETDPVVRAFLRDVLCASGWARRSRRFNCMARDQQVAALWYQMLGQQQRK